MGALAFPSPWIPEDDLLLKNAIEAGASLESLAKGAVQFSRRFTIKELQGRWLALLYDPIVSTKAVEQIVELERSSNIPSKSNNSKGSKDSYGKRKAESVRRCYSKRKRVCHDPLDDDLSSLLGLGSNCFLNGAEALVLNNIFGDPMVVNDVARKESPGPNIFEGDGIQENQICSRFAGNTDFNPFFDYETSSDHMPDTPMPEMSDWKPVKGFSVPELPCDYLKNSTGYHESFFDVFKYPFNFGGEDDILIDIDGEERFPSMPEVIKPAAEGVYIDIPSSTGPEEMNDTVDTPLGEVNLLNTSDTPIPATSACAVKSEFPEFCNGAICCSLNTDDPEIPCNDDVFPGKPQKSYLKRTQSEANNSSLHGKDNTETQSSGKDLSTLKKEQRWLGESRPASQMQLPDVGPSCATDDLGVKYETSKAETNNGSRSTSSRYGVPGQSLPVVKTELSEPPLSRQPSCSITEKKSQNADIAHLQTAVGETNQEGQTSSAHKNQDLQALGFMECMAADPGGESLLSDAEEQVFEIDTDIPYFSDVESMIVEMDLGPEDQDSFCSREVAIYQQENMKREIIRLEQNAHSYMQRALATHDAFAILYGRHSKHYIKKAEVLLGRATDDVPVDIDLGREGHANKISRRQAIIKMDKDGAFNLKNTGKCSLYVNSKDIFPGQSLVLHSNCLIEIRGISFIFEINQARIKQYLDDAASKLDDKKPRI